MADAGDDDERQGVDAAEGDGQGVLRLQVEVEIDDAAIDDVDEAVHAFVSRAHEIAVAVLGECGVHGGEVELGLHIVDAARIAELNREHRGVEGATDVLSFPIDGIEPLPAGMPRMLGDVVVCVSHVAGQVADGTTMLPHGPGQEQGDATLEQALERCVAHGVLHLLGHDHELGDDQARRMFDIEQRVLDAVRAS